MEQIKNMNLPIVGKIQHGEQIITQNGTKRVKELGYFIAKTKNDNMQLVLDRFNERYPKRTSLIIHFFDENPLSVRRIRYNQGGAICYCMAGQNQAKQRTTSGWKTINCTSECTYSIPSDEISKPMCNLEATLKFLLPEISNDRIWIMKITGQTSIKRLQAYINLQRQLGNSLIGNYILFLKQEQQTNKTGKTFNNYILDIMRENPINSNNSNSKDYNNQIPLSPNTNTDIETTIEINKKSEKMNIKKSSKQPKSTKKQDSLSTENNISSNLKEQEKNNEELEEYYSLLETKMKSFLKDGKSKNYLVASFVNSKDEPIDVVIPPEFSEELLQCDLGTLVKLDLKTSNNNTFTKNIQYIQKYIKNAVA